MEAKLVVESKTKNEVILENTTKKNEGILEETLQYMNYIHPTFFHSHHHQCLTNKF
jgi:hypothetical protein